jgi:hypothetical protein
MRHKVMPVLVILQIAVFFLAACTASNPASQQSAANLVPSSTPAGQASQTTSESPIAPETNPVGDIPDTQTFVTYSASSGNYSLEVPEGWARTTKGSDVRYVDKFDGVSVTLKPAASAPAAASAAQNEVAALSQSERAFKVGDVADVKLPGGQAVRITASANSDPDPVTGKQVRLEEEIYFFYHNGAVAMVKLWAPQGADNVDQWKRMVESFGWK